jgi:N-methylhydantoinase B
MNRPKGALDSVRLEVFRHLFTAMAEEMGAALRGAAYSPNIKERRDYSCALFDSAGHVVAMGDHMPRPPRCYADVGPGRHRTVS